MLLVQLPLPVGSVRLIEAVAQTAVGPAIADGNGLTVITDVVVQPVGNVYTILGVPAATPVTTPVADPIVALETSLLLQVPPPISLSVTVEATQTSIVPEIAEGKGLTVTVELPVIVLVQKVVASVATDV